MRAFACACSTYFPCADVSIHGMTLCERCAKCKDENRTLYSAANDMDPGDCPPCLQDLTVLEQMAIAPCALLMSVHRAYTKKPRNNAQANNAGMGQLVSTGHIMHLMKPDDEYNVLLNTLPRLPAQCDTVFLVKERAGNAAPFRIPLRRHRVEEAVRWLCEHNQVFRRNNIVFDPGHLDAWNQVVDENNMVAIGEGGVGHVFEVDNLEEIDEAAAVRDGDHGLWCCALLCAFLSISQPMDIAHIHFFFCVCVVFSLCMLCVSLARELSD